MSQITNSELVSKAADRDGLGELGLGIMYAKGLGRTAGLRGGGDMFLESTPKIGPMPTPSST